MKDINKILSEEIKSINPPEEIIAEIKEISKRFITDFKGKLKTKKISAEVFLGGSLAKATLVKKDKYDADIFVRFDKKYKKDDISAILGSLLDKTAEKIHGSRDYFQIEKNKLVIEIIPVLKINAPKEAENVTDLSYFHVNYVLKKIMKNKRLADEIKLAKTFCHAQDCYGAESYIHGFSGYALELLILHYGSFLNLISEIAHSKDDEKIIIDDERHYKNKSNVMMEVNESKLSSPIVLIDPTYKERNALASLNIESYLKFKNAGKKFLKDPKIDFFEKKDKVKELSEKYKDLRVFLVRTKKQKGDIAGTKLRKFFYFFVSRLKKEFDIKEQEFTYDFQENIARYYFVVGKKATETIKGPPITETKGLTGFKKVHPDAFIKDHVAYARLAHGLSLEEFLRKFNKKDKKIIEDMDIAEIRLER